MFKKVLPILSLLALGFTILPAQNKQKTTTGFEKYQNVGGDLPELKIISGKMQTFTNKDFKTNGHFFLVMFNPTCSHCIKMTELIGNNSGQFKNSKVAFMTPASMMSYLGPYEQETKIYEHPEFVVGVDSAWAVDKLYTFGLLPQINIYDHNHHLVKTFKGDTPMDSLAAYLP